MIKLAIAQAIVLTVAAFASWAFLPARYLPGNRARHLRIRLHLRLHPGKGFAHIASLHLRWGRLAMLRRSGRIRPALPLRYRIADPAEHSVFLGRAHYRHRLNVSLEEHLLVMSPPRMLETAFLADVILQYPGPVPSHPAYIAPGRRAAAVPRSHTVAAGAQHPSPGRRGTPDAALASRRRPAPVRQADVQERKFYYLKTTSDSGQGVIWRFTLWQQTRDKRERLL
jgi:hypothetical protein